MKKLIYSLALGLALNGALFAAPAGPTEYEIKAAFLYNFSKFVEWPAEPDSSSSNAFVVGILGHDPFGEDLDIALKDKTIRDRKIVLKRISDVTSALTCNVLFISASKEIEVRPILDSLKGLPILTVSDIDDFIERGGIVGFSVEGKKVRFSINTKAAERANLKISSQLLKLAKTIISRRFLEITKYAWLPFKIIQSDKS